MSTGLSAFDVSMDVPASTDYDDDGRPRRTGTVWTASAHIITAVIGSGVLSLGWSVAQLGWIAGPIVMFLFSIVTYYASVLLAACYRTGDPDTGKRNYSYMDAVKSNLDEFQVKLCGWIQYTNLFGTAIGYTIASALSMVAIMRSHCVRTNGNGSPCHVSNNPYMIAFGIAEIIFSQIPDFDKLEWLSIIASVMSFTYSTISLVLGIAKVVENRKFLGSLTGPSIGMITMAQKVWRTCQALGAIAFAFSYSNILIEIQDTIKSPPSEYETMRKASFLSITTTTIFYMLCGCFGFAAFGDSSPGNFLTAFDSFKAYWIVDIANAAIVIHLVGAYQVYSQPLFAFVEKFAFKCFPTSTFITREITLQIPGSKKHYGLNLFRLIWRTIFVIITTFISMLLPFFTDIVGILGALGFWPLTIYYPVEMYILHQRIQRWSVKWICLQAMSMVCLAVSVAAAVGSVVGVIYDLQVYKPFKTSD